MSEVTLDQYGQPSFETLVHLYQTAEISRNPFDISRLRLYRFAKTTWIHTEEDNLRFQIDNLLEEMGEGIYGN